MFYFLDPQSWTIIPGGSCYRAFAANSWIPRGEEILEEMTLVILGSQSYVLRHKFEHSSALLYAARVAAQLDSVEVVPLTQVKFIPSDFTRILLCIHIVCWIYSFLIILVGLTVLYWSYVMAMPSSSSSYPLSPQASAPSSETSTPSSETSKQPQKTSPSLD